MTISNSGKVKPALFMCSIVPLASKVASHKKPSCERLSGRLRFGCFITCFFAACIGKTTFSAAVLPRHPVGKNKVQTGGRLSSGQERKKLRERQRQESGSGKRAAAARERRLSSGQEIKRQK
ncbi:hypothetical protein AB6T85_14385 [Erwinia sp. ACCC 02193]|uniref:Uncharacterized protein n=1 Tax=Erwinia aeris TaxID=3239803 RepID=A0ABV4E9V7_9GAMM